MKGLLLLVVGLIVLVCVIAAGLIVLAPFIALLIVLGLVVFYLCGSSGEDEREKD